MAAACFHPQISRFAAGNGRTRGAPGHFDAVLLEPARLLLPCKYGLDFRIEDLELVVAVSVQSGLIGVMDRPKPSFRQNDGPRKTKPYKTSSFRRNH